MRSGKPAVPRIISITGKPAAMRSLCGTLRATPWIAPEAITMVLLGLGVADIATANATAERSQVQSTITPPSVVLAPSTR